jgi:hypothetical protein
MKRAISVVLALALSIVLVPAAFASEAELSDIERPVDAAITQYPQSSNGGALAGGEAVTEPVDEEQIWVEPLRHEGF